MEIGATHAYKKIDDVVVRTLEEAAKVLQELEVVDCKSQNSVLSSHSSSSYESRKTISIGSAHHSSSQQPRATIRTPRDVNKNRNLFFPPASIGVKSTPIMRGGTSPGTTDISSIDPVTPTPDSLFPEAVYIPASKKTSNIRMISSSQSRESRCVRQTSQIESVHRLHIQKLAVEPLEDIKQLKCRGIKKSKPDEMFPKATYSYGGHKPIMAISPVTSSLITSVDTSSSSAPSMTTSAASSDQTFQPMEFVSTDGRVKMMLQPVDEKMKKKETTKKVIAAAAAKCEEFPIVPKQLQSSTKLKTVEHHRTKFSTKWDLGDFSIDLSGIFNGNSMNKKELSKLVINGQSYSI